MFQSPQQTKNVNQTSAELKISVLLTPEAEQEEESYVQHITSTIKSEKKKNDELINQVTEFAKELKNVK